MFWDDGVPIERFREFLFRRRNDFFRFLNRHLTPFRFSGGFVCCWLDCLHRQGPFFEPGHLIEGPILVCGKNSLRLAEPRIAHIRLLEICSLITEPPPNTFVIESEYANSTLNNVLFYRNGVQTASTSNSGAINITPGITIGQILEGTAPTTGPWKGDIAEVMVFDHKLTSTEMTQLDGELADKYGIYDPNATWPSTYTSAVQTEITKHQWNKTQTDSYVAFQAANSTMLTTGLTAWFKADAGVTQSSGAVSSWADQTGNYTVTQSVSGNKPTYISSDVNGEPGVRFNGSQWLANTSTVSAMNADMTMITVATNTAGLAHAYPLWMGNSTTTGTNRGIGYNGGNETFDGYGTGAFGVAEPLATSFSCETASINSALTSVNFYRDGTLTTTGSSSGLVNLSPGITVGRILEGTSSTGAWQGDVAEVLVYDHQLSSTELAQVGGYLADKYGLYNPNATWPNAYSSAVQAEITKHQWIKAQADNYVAMQAANPTVLTNGLTVWFKADAGVTQSSGIVSAWTDQTGNHSVSQSTGANKPTYVSSDLNGEPAVRFNGSQWLANTTCTEVGLNADMTMITVAMTTGASHEYPFWMGNGTTSYASRGIGYNGSVEVLDIFNGGSSGTAEPAPYAFVDEIDTINSTLNTVTFYRDGAQTASGSISGVLNLTPGTEVGGLTNNGSTYAWQGDVAEVLVYDHQLSSTEQQQVEVYLGAC